MVPYRRPCEFLIGTVTYKYTVCNSIMLDNRILGAYKQNSITCICGDTVVPYSYITISYSFDIGVKIAVSPALLSITASPLRGKIYRISAKGVETVVFYYRTVKPRRIIALRVERDSACTVGCKARRGLG